MIAGPNGSGKTTLARYLISQSVPLGQYINPDDIAKYIDFFTTLQSTEALLGVSKSTMSDGSEQFSSTFAAKLAQSIAVGLREEWVDAGLSLTYESVMSHESHLGFVDKANKAGSPSVRMTVVPSDTLFL